METLQKKAFNFEIKDNGVGVITLDYPAEKINKLSSHIFLELEELLKDISKNMEIKCLLFVSAKKDSFIVGADIHELKDVNTAQLGEQMSERAQSIFNRLSRMRMTTIAVINGPCMGGGLEFALACDYRIISDNPKTLLALPEVKLGLIPGAGGTQRLPRLVGLQDALDMIVSGKNIRPKKALKMGLVDEVVPTGILMEVAMERAVEFGQKGKRIGNSKNNSVKDWLLEETKLGKNIIGKKAREKVMESTGGKYPAPLKAIDVVIDGDAVDLEKGLKLEAQAFGELCESSVSKNLISIFEASNELKKPYPGAAGQQLPPVKKIGILGAGLMGSGIAKVSLEQDLIVRMKDINHEAIGKGLKSIRDFFQKNVDKKIIRPYDLQMKMDKVSGTTDYSGFKRADFVIEAVFEDLQIKQTMFRELEAIVSETCVLASNTSSIPISEISSGLKNPERVIGMHFFSPVEKMPLLEVIVTPQTAEWVIASTVELGKKIGKTVIIVNDGLGFYTTRIISPYINEALHILIEGGDVRQVDKVMVEFGFPVGPFKLLDEVGIDVGTKVAKLLSPAFPRMTPPLGSEKLGHGDRKGRKTNKGFYYYPENSAEVDPTVYEELGIVDKRAFTDEEIKTRLVFTFLNEVAFCLEDNILRGVKDGDIGAIFGLGFPPFLGGPFKYMDSLGLKNVAETLGGLTKKHGERFTPSKKIMELAQEGKTFY
jgi:3-hydroxyacyl-CoA dehydrogenase/enoyl-CoA hydratase/3-hydroxybutyryl-CoA epimerase